MIIWFTLSIFLKSSKKITGQINPSIKKEEAKVVDTVNAEDIKGKAVMCRCWRSKTFPACDGAHVQHNKETGDNVGPLIVNGVKAAPVAMMGTSGLVDGVPPLFFFPSLLS